ncbi:MAG: hypothetical protein ACP5M0_16000, partial [Desulfomonilaceae bacterium]
SDIHQRKQQAKLGCAHAHKLFDLIRVQKKEGVKSPRAFSDYVIQFQMSGLPKGVQAGFLVHGEGGKATIHWGQPPDGLHIV